MRLMKKKGGWQQGSGHRYSVGLTAGTSCVQGRAAERKTRGEKAGNNHTALSSLGKAEPIWFPDASLGDWMLSHRSLEGITPSLVPSRLHEAHVEDGRGRMNPRPPQVRGSTPGLSPTSFPLHCTPCVCLFFLPLSWAICNPTHFLNFFHCYRKVSWSTKRNKTYMDF